MRIEEVASTAKAQRVATHTHIKGLGIRDDGVAVPMAAGFVGQEQAREACGVVVDMIRCELRARDLGDCVPLTWCVRMRVRAFVCVSVCEHACACVWAGVWAGGRVRLSAFVCMHVCVCTCCAYTHARCRQARVGGVGSVCK